MAVTSRRLVGGDISNWASLAIGPEASITDTFVQNTGDGDAYISVDQNWGQYILLKKDQSIAFDGMTWADLQHLYVSDDGNGAVIGILAVSR